MKPDTQLSHNRRALFPVYAPDWAQYDNKQEMRRDRRTREKEFKALVYALLI